MEGEDEEVGQVGGVEAGEELRCEGFGVDWPETAVEGYDIKS